MSSSVFVLRSPPKDASSASEWGQDSPRAPSSDSLIKISSALDSLPSDVQDEVLKRFLDDVLAVRLSPTTSSAQNDHLPQLSAEVTCSLNTVPPELRLKIFKLVLPAEWEGNVPALIKALRPISQLYQEATTMFFTRSKRFRLHRDNEWSFGDMSDKALLTIGCVSIHVNDGRDDPRLPNNPAPNLSYLRTVFPKCKKVRFVCIRVPWGMNGFWPLLPGDYVSRLLVGFKKLYQVCFRIPNTAMSQHLLGCLRPSSTVGIIEHTNNLLGTIAITRDVSIFPPVPLPVFLVTLYGGRQEDSTSEAYTFAYIEDEDRDGWLRFQPHPRIETWQWKAEKGKFLKELV